MASAQTASILIPLLFVILFQVLTIIRDMDKRIRIFSEEELEYLSYNGIKFGYSMAFVGKTFIPSINGLLKIGRFGLFHTLLEFYMLATFVTIFELELEQDLLIAIMNAHAVLWMLLPLFEVPEYSEIIGEGIFPLSISFHIVVVLILILAIRALMEFSMGNNVPDYAMVYLSRLVPGSSPLIIVLFSLAYLSLFRYELNSAGGDN